MGKRLVMMGKIGPVKAGHRNISYSFDPVILHEPEVIEPWEFKLFDESDEDVSPSGWHGVKEILE